MKDEGGRMSRPPRVFSSVMRLPPGCSVPRRPAIHSFVMRIDELLGRGKPAISFEFFPPKNDAGFAQLYRTIGELPPLRPSYVSVTYGAGGSTREKTVTLVERI